MKFIYYEILYNIIRVRMSTLKRINKKKELIV